MPLNDDPEALDDESYWAMFEDAEPCPGRVPDDVLAAALARLDGDA